MTRRPAAALALAALVALVALQAAPAGASSHQRQTVSPGELWEVQLPENVTATLQPVDAGRRVRFQVLDQLGQQLDEETVTASGQRVARAFLTVPRTTCTPGQDQQLAVLSTQLSDSGTSDGPPAQVRTVLPLHCPATYTTSLEVEPDLPQYRSDIDYARRGGADGRSDQPQAPDVSLCVTDGSGRPVPVGADEGTEGRLSATESQELDSREGPPVQRDEALRLFDSSSRPGCAAVQHLGATSDQFGDVLLTGALDVDGDGRPTPPRDSATTVDLTLVTSRHVAVERPCKEDDGGAVLTGEDFLPGVVVVVVDGEGRPVSPESRTTTGPDGAFVFDGFDLTGALAGRTVTVRERRSDGTEFGQALADVHAERVVVPPRCAEDEPTLTTPPGYVRPGGAETLVRVELTGFPPAPVRFRGSPSPLFPGTYDEAGNETPSVVRRDGTFSGYVKVRDARCGPQTIEAEARGATATATTQVLCPALTVDPPSIREKEQPRTVRALGSGFRPSHPVRVTRDSSVVDVTADPDGSFAVDVPVTGVTCPGTERPSSTTTTIVAREVADSGTASTALRVTCDPPDKTVQEESPPVPQDPPVTVPPPPTVQVEPGRAAHTPGARPVEVVLRGFAPSRPVTVTVSGAPFGTAPPGEGERVLPGTVVGLPCGPHPVEASDGAGRAQTTLVITCPQLQVGPERRHVDELPGPTTVVGTGFDPRTRVLLTVPGAEPREVTTGDDGAFRDVVTVGEPPCGLQSVRAVERVDLPVPPEATGSYLLDCPAPPTLVVDPPVVAASTGRRTVQVHGTGWRPGSTLEVRGAGTVTPVRVDEAGSFRAPVDLLAPAPGTLAVTAAQPYREASGGLLVTLPQLTATPPVVEADAPPPDVLVEGTGFDPGVGVVIAVPGVAPVTVRSSDSGTVATTVPAAALACGSGVVTAVEAFGPGGPADPPPSATTELRVDCPLDPVLGVRPDPTAFTPGARPYALTGNGFRPVPLVVLVDGRPVRELLGHPAGLLDLVLPLRGLACGPHALTVLPQRGRAATAPFTVTCPVLTATPDEVDDRARPPTLRLTGTGFDPSTDVTVAVPGGPSVPGRTDARGTLVVTVPASTLPCGPVALRAVERVRLAVPPSAVARATVRCTPYTPEVRVVPLVAVEGEVVTVEGTGFHPLSQVQVTWLVQGGTGLGEATGTTDAAGAFRSSMLLFSHDRLGPRRARGVDAQGAAAEGPLLVVPGSAQPGRHQVTVHGRRGMVNRR